MTNSYKFSWYFLLLIPAFFIKSAQGVFQKSALKKTLKISLQTRLFLKNIQVMQHEFLSRCQNCATSDQSCLKVCKDMLDFNAELYEQAQIDSLHLKRLFELVGQLSALLAWRDCSVECSFKMQAWQKFWEYLKESLKFLTMMGYESDRAWLKEQIVQIDYSVRNAPCVDKLILTRLVKVCMNVIHQFDGVMVTEFDLVLLANLIIACVMLQC